ncbi:MAG: hypothetical protein Tsb0010_09480 [Parvularculaceae bacterium]
MIQTFDALRRKFASADRILLISAAIVAISAVAPLLAVRFPPLNDYPFHLARIVILADLSNPFYDRFYDLGSFLLPNVALDAIALPLAKLIGAEAAVRLFMVLSLLSILAGVAALHYAAFGRASAWPLLAAPLLYNGIFRFGFLNYIFGLGLALIAAAVWLRMGRDWRRLVFGFLASVALMLCHMSAFGVFAVIAGGSEIYRRLSTSFSGGKPGLPDADAIAGLLAAAAPFVAAIGLFALLSPTSQSEGAAFQYAAYWGAKPLGALFSLSAGLLWLDLASLAAYAGIGFYALATGRLRAAPPLLAAAAFLALAIAVLPTGLLGSWYADIRLAPALALLLIAATGMKTETGMHAGLAAAAAGLAALHGIALAAQWRGLDRTAKGVIAGLEAIEPGATVFTAYTDDHAKIISDDAAARALWRPPLTHMGSYAVLHAPVFVPMTWTDPAKQPLNVAPDYAAAKAFQGHNPFAARDAGALNETIARIADFAARSEAPLGPVYLFVTGRALPPDFNPGAGAEMVARGPFHMLIKIGDA